MAKIFKLVDGTHVDPVEHTREIVRTKDVIEVVVGTDAQAKRHHTCFVTTIVYKYMGRGAHYIYCRENVKKIKDRRVKLREEMDRSLEVAQMIEDRHPITWEVRGTKVDTIELDFNRKELEGSHFMVHDSVGEVRGMGFDCKVKPDEGLSAIKAADWIVRK